MSTEREHAALIHAWADGAIVEEYYPNIDEWEENNTPSWHPKIQYRIKPVTKLDVAIAALEKIYKIGTQSRVIDISEDALNKIRGME